MLGFAHRADELHGRIEKLGMKVGDVALVHAAFQFVGVVGETYAVLLNNIACTADGSGTVIAMFGYFITGSGYDKTGTSGDVESVLSVAARTDDIDGAIGSEVYRYTCLHEGFAKT